VPAHVGSEYYSPKGLRLSEFANVNPGVFAGRYLVERALSAGSTATVHLAREIDSGRLVAIKVLKPELAESFSGERFVREIRLTAKLRHPNIAPLLDAGTHNGQPYFVLPYLDGGTLRDRLERDRQLTQADALEITRKVGSALTYAHLNGIIHRDVKPENILFADNEPLLADFGIARALKDAMGENTTTTGVVVGTPAYMSPEQASGEKHVDARTDVFSLACVVYEMLAGMPAFSGPTSQSVMAQRMTHGPRPLNVYRPTVDKATAEVIEKGLAPAPGDRWQSVDEFVKALDLAYTGSPGTPDSGARPVRSRRRTQLFAGVVAAALALAAGWYAWSPWAGTRGHVALDPHLVVVAPFAIPEPQLAVWREGLAELAASDLDGAGTLRAVSPSVAFRRWRGRSDQTSAAELGFETGAGYAVFGSLLRAGADSVRLSATVVDVAGRSAIGDIELDEDVSRMDHLGDRLTVAVLRTLGKTSPGAEVRLAGAARPTSLPALKAFLQAEHYFRRTAWDSAQIYYQRAVELDTTLALGYLRLSLVISWRSLEGDSLARVYALRAGQFNHGLTPRDSVLIEAEKLRARAIARFLDPEFWQDYSRLMSVLESATQMYPDDRELWYALGEARRDFGGSVRPALEAFDRAIAADSGFAPAYIDPVFLAMAAGGVDAARRYLDHYLSLHPVDVHADGLRLAARLLDPQTSAADASVLLNAASPEVLYHALDAVAYWPDSGEMVIRLARLFASGRRTTVLAFTDSTFTSYQLAIPLAFRGHLREAFKVLGEQPAALARRPGSQYTRAVAIATIVMMGGAPAADAGRFFAQLREGVVERPTGLVLALPWWSARRDAASIRKVAERAESAARTNRSAVERPYLQYLGSAARAYLALAQGDSSGALTRLLALPVAGCMYPYCPFERLVASQLLTARGKYSEAAALLDEIPNLYNPISVLWRLQQARVAEKLGRRDDAVRGYAYVADIWARADADLQPSVREASAALTRLRGGSRR
jgi:serine/threonine-protein kinase